MKLADKIHYAGDIRLEVLQKLKRDERPLFMYGAGKAARLRIEWLKEYDIEIEGVCVDSEYYNENQYIESYKVYDIERVKAEYPKYNLFIGFENHTGAQEAIRKNQNENSTVFYLEDPFKFKYMSFDFYLRNSEKYQKAYDLLEDELSREIFVAALNSRLRGCSEEIAKFQSKSLYGYQYDLLQPSKSEVFVDCGAYDGDTVEEFVGVVNNHYKEIYAFEPDVKNAENLRKKVASDKIHIIEKGTGKECGKASFYVDSSIYSNFVSSNLWGSGTRRDLYQDVNRYEEVDITTLDSELQGIEVTLIKMDIEGSELDALIGAKGLISQYYPKLAICVYHKQEDLFSILLYIHQLEGGRKKYKYYMRHHSNNLSETVLYAIPIEGN